MLDSLRVVQDIEQQRLATKDTWTKDDYEAWHREVSFTKFNLISLQKEYEDEKARADMAAERERDLKDKVELYKQVVLVLQHSVVSILVINVFILIMNFFDTSDRALIPLTIWYVFTGAVCVALLCCSSRFHTLRFELSEAENRHAKYVRWVQNKEDDMRGLANKLASLRDMAESKGYN